MACGDKFAELFYLIVKKCYFIDKKCLDTPMWLCYN